MQIQLMLNGEVVASTWEDNREDTEDSGSQVAYDSGVEFTSRCLQRVTIKSIAHRTWVIGCGQY